MILPANLGSTTSKSRLLFLLSLFLSVPLIYLGHLFSIQVINSNEYQNRAKQVSQRTIPIQARRGEIFDRNYDQPIVANIDAFSIELIPAELPSENIESYISELAGLIGKNTEEILKKIPANRSNAYQPVEITNNATFQIISYIAEHRDQFPGVVWRNKPIRYYSEGATLAHVTGFVGDISRQELQLLYNEGYSYGSVIGKAGIESVYDKLLRGEDGIRFKTVDARGRIIESAADETIPPRLGRNLVLTIDRHIQRLSAQALGERVGSVVVLKPASGEILAMVSYPSFDPNHFYGPQGGETFRMLALDSSKPFFNRSIQAAYVPASTFKIIMTAAIIEENAFPINKTVSCTGSFEYGDRVFRCHVRTGHGPMSLYDALAESCDVYYYTVGAEYLGPDKIAEYSKRFGLGFPTGVDLPGEAVGRVPDPEWKRRSLNARWVGGDTVNTSIGQGYLETTPIQMANAVAMVVNRGTIYRPHLVKEIRDVVTGEIVTRIEPEVVHQTELRDETFTMLQEAMRGVITQGTAQVVITTPSVTVAGKTGTGEVGKPDSWHSWFVAYGPYGAAPEDAVVVVVMVEAVNTWEWWAPKAANAIFHGIFSGERISLDQRPLPLGRME